MKMTLKEFCLSLAARAICSQEDGRKSKGYRSRKLKGHGHVPRLPIGMEEHRALSGAGFPTTEVATYRGGGSRGCRARYSWSSYADAELVRALRQQTKQLADWI